MSVYMCGKLFSLSGSTTTTTISMQTAGGYDYQFVYEPPDRLICQICKYPSWDPYLSACCGYVFCKSCLDAVKRALTISYACPICRSEEFFTVPNKQADREIRSLHVFCTNKGKGCEWQSELNHIIHHLENSDGWHQFEDTHCPKGCGKMLQWRHLANHVKTGCAHGEWICLLFTCCLLAILTLIRCMYVTV